MSAEAPETELDNNEDIPEAPSNITPAAPADATPPLKLVNPPDPVPATESLFRRETRAIGKVISAVEDLPPSSKARVIQYVAHYLNEMAGILPTAKVPAVPQ